MSKKETDDERFARIGAQLINEPIDLKVHQIGTKKYFDDCAAAFKIKLSDILAENKLGGDVDSFAIESLCRSYRRLIEYNYMLSIEGPIVNSPQGVKANPLASMVQQEERIFRGYLSDFALNPKSRNNRNDAFSNKPPHGNSNRSKSLKLINGG